LAWTLFRFRDQGQRASFFEGNSTMEFVWTLGTMVMFVGLGLYGEHAWAEAHFQGAAPGALQVEVTGQQFQWQLPLCGTGRQMGPDEARTGQRLDGQPAGAGSEGPQRQR
jgi:heme/copper-type cytochrome/quinol oxidase subunit 2